LAIPICLWCDRDRINRELDMVSPKFVTSLCLGNDMHHPP
jgi:hypothetical protein